jgi:hypothetical protein
MLKIWNTDGVDQWLEYEQVCFTPGARADALRQQIAKRQEVIQQHHAEIRRLKRALRAAEAEDCLLLAAQPIAAHPTTRTAPFLTRGAALCCSDQSTWLTRYHVRGTLWDNVWEFPTFWQKHWRFLE